MLRLVRTSLIVIGAAVCGPELAGVEDAERVEPTTQVSTEAASYRGATVSCLLCWPAH